MKKIVILTSLFFFTSFFMQAMEPNHKFLIVTTTDELTVSKEIAPMLLGAWNNKPSGLFTWTQIGKIGIGVMNGNIIALGKNTAKQVAGLGNVIHRVMNQLQKDYGLTDEQKGKIIPYGLDVATSLDVNEEGVNQLKRWNEKDASLVSKQMIIKKLIESGAQFIAGRSRHDAISFPIYFKKLKNKNVDLAQLLPAGCAFFKARECIQGSEMQAIMRADGTQWPIELVDPITYDTNSQVYLMAALTAFKNLGGKKCLNIYVYADENHPLSGLQGATIDNCQVHFVSNEKRLAHYLSKETIDPLQDRTLQVVPAQSTNNSGNALVAHATNQQNAHQSSDSEEYESAASEFDSDDEPLFDAKAEQAVANQDNQSRRSSSPVQSEHEEEQTPVFTPVDNTSSVGDETNNPEDNNATPALQKTQKSFFNQYKTRLFTFTGIAALYGFYSYAKATAWSPFSTIFSWYGKSKSSMTGLWGSFKQRWFKSPVSA